MSQSVDAKEIRGRGAMRGQTHLKANILGTQVHSDRVKGLGLKQIRQ